MVEDNQKDYIKGDLLHLIYHNEESLYTVAKIKVTETSYSMDDKEVAIVGIMPPIERDVSYLFYGFFSDHPRFGRQYKVEQFHKIMPETEQGIILYLSSDRFPGIGKKTAEKIVQTLGKNAISIIIENRSSLDKVTSIKRDKADEIYETLLEDQGIEQVLVRLYEYGFGLQLAMKVYQAYKTDALDIINHNPYKMIEDVEGIGFAKADLIGRKQGIEGAHPDRLRAAIIFTLNEQSLNEGHVYVLNETIVKGAKALLEYENTEEISPLKIADQVIELGEEGKVIVDGDKMYIPTLYYAEQGIVSNIQRLLEREPEKYPDSEFYKALGLVEETLGIHYAPSQQEAIKEALHSPVMILTGGPGTGKTTVIKGLVEVYGQLNGMSVNPDDYAKKDAFPIIMAAPTGRAAKRMSESTGLPSSTIHRLLGFKGTEDYEDDEVEKLEGELIILDEMSMVDTWLANQLFKAIPNDMKVILVGDEDQLPSVGPGQVLSDLLTTNIVPSVKLTDIYRQSEGSHIITFSHSVKDGHLDQVKKDSKDLRFFPAAQQQIPDVVKQICKGAIAKGYEPKDIQVLAPMYRGIAGVENLNVMLQSLFNPPTPQRREVPFGDVVYRTGDIVLQLVNNPEENVFNGDRGEIVAIFTEKENTDKELKIVISFDGIEITYTKQELTQITHAYCCSIHKSQGSEFPIVIMPIVKGYYRMLRKKLIYTGITRAKNFLLLCGEWQSLEYAVKNDQDIKRNTTLALKLKNEPMENEYQHETDGASKH
ncbi:SF1B family DNA helicase RecD2 [Evansella cellulosilytica]|uniref:ATP-dependent RecD2 DNA helicase n=1 Tax=Evansella cellulosilytica (strain ATCC 21833 / DSM 2522 / FERM P-1141 / JCM 9156 / N-4) TaxID=649639 RepID=E6TV99_EVAC2|nr:ATP-dependent RecD-like DNA helicase [Evansella cellulosilytica]ADU29783.1 helicase, RecD/TraA family [Evansella cellulosilytica DSM 2522]